MVTKQQRKPSAEAAPVDDEQSSAAGEADQDSGGQAGSVPPDPSVPLPPGPIIGTAASGVVSGGATGPAASGIVSGEPRPDEG